MIDWLSLFFNSFWILGLAILLATFSFHHYLAKQAQRPLRSELESRSFSRWFWGGLLLICIGLAGTSDVWWETAVWVIFTLLIFINLYQTLRQVSH